MSYDVVAVCVTGATLYQVVLSEHPTREERDVELRYYKRLWREHELAEDVVEVLGADRTEPSIEPRIQKGLIA